MVGAAVSSVTDAELTFRELVTTAATSSKRQWVHGLSGIVSSGTDNKPSNVTCWGGGDGKGRPICVRMADLGKANVNVVERRVKAVSLTDLLLAHNAPRVIDYLSLDIEGAEEAALSTFDFHAFKFLVLSIERRAGVHLYPWSGSAKPHGRSARPRACSWRV